MLEYSKREIDDLDLEDRDYMDAVRSLKKVKIDHFLEHYLKVAEPELYEKLISTCTNKTYRK
jgi:hypothetical protein